MTTILSLVSDSTSGRSGTQKLYPVVMRQRLKRVRKRDRRNCVYWSHVSPNSVMEDEQSVSGVPVGGGELAVDVVGPCFVSEESVTVDSHLVRPQTIVWPQGKHNFLDGLAWQ